MSLTALILSLAAILLYFAVRGHWIAYQVKRYSLLASYWSLMTKQGVVVMDELSMVWPTREMLLDWPWRWTWRRYVVHQDLYDAMESWVDRQLTRSDLDYGTFVRETNAAAGLTEDGTKLAVDTVKAPTDSEADDPERN